MRKFEWLLIVALVCVPACVRNLDGTLQSDILMIEQGAMLSTAVAAAMADQQQLDVDVLILQVQTMKALVNANPDEIIPVLQAYVNTEVEPRYRTVAGLTVQIVVTRVSPILTGNLPEIDKTAQVIAVTNAVLNGAETALVLHKSHTQGGQ